MVDTALLKYLERSGIEYRLNADTSLLVSFKIGGLSKIVIYPSAVSELCEVLCRLKNCKRIIIGNGTNCYFTNEFYDGAVVSTGKISHVTITNDRLCAECGASLSKICEQAQNSSLSGLEFAYGIPGTLGGAVAMNASAFGVEISNVVYKSVAFDIEKGEEIELDHKGHLFSLKSSIFRNSSLCHLRSELLLKNGDKNDILNKMLVHLKKRMETQPNELPSAGSTFVRPRNGFASQMIDLCGLKGFCVGDAQVSDKHAGFIVNKGHATADDVQKLIKVIKNKVFEKFNVELEEEIIFIE